mgnify:CR=1 FL=1
MHGPGARRDIGLLIRRKKRQVRPVLEVVSRNEVCRAGIEVQPVDITRYLRQTA